jgi:uncharacterized protein (DUF433 family)
MDRIPFNPDQCGGRPCIRGMRIRVKDVLDLLAGGVSEAEVLADFPYLEKRDIRACLAFAAAEADHAILVAGDHRIIDGDGYWVEYDPVFSEPMPEGQSGRASSTGEPSWPGRRTIKS